MTKLEGMTNDHMTERGDLPDSSFLLRHFVWGAMRLDIPSSNCRPVAAAPPHRAIVSRRVGPTLTMDNFAPVNSEMCLTYFLASEGRSENLRAD